MSLSDFLYVFVDPFGVPTSGVTAYTNLASAQLRDKGINTKTIARTSNEKLFEFKKRVSLEVRKLSGQVVRLIVEAPESLATTCEIPDGVCIHIRLHCSRSLGALLQGQRYSTVDVDIEQNEINRASYISAPSQAAVTASGLIFNFSQSVLVYPNPIGTARHKRKELESNIDVLFIGRYQEFKGVPYVFEAAKRLPSLSFYIACPDVGVLSSDLPTNVYFLDGINSRKDDLISRAKVVFIPSKFETASMVGLESIAMGTPVVTWRHIPLNEYFSSPWLFSVPYDDVDSMVCMLKEVVSRKKPDFDCSPIRFLNADFDIGVFGILTGQVCSIAHLKPLGDEINNVILGLPNRKGLVMQKNNGSWQRIQRKIRKLRRNPVAFFLDSKGIDGVVFRYVYRFFYKEVRAYTVDPGAVNLPPSIEEIKDFDDGFPHQIGNSLKLGKVHRNEKIQLNNVAGKSDGWLSALVYMEDNVGLIGDLIPALDAFSDFSPLKSSALMHLMVDVDRFEPVVQILNRCDLKNKEKISEVNNFILFDVKENLIEAIRSSGVRQRIILVVTKVYDIDFKYVSNFVDALICLDSIDISNVDFRRVNLISSLAKLPSMLRKVIQEIGPKKPDMLIPVIGGNKYEPGFFEFDPARFQGVVRLKSYVDLRCSSFNEYISEFSENVEELFLIESVYMRYRNLCEGVEKGDKPVKLIELCLYDGVLFDVN